MITLRPRAQPSAAWSVLSPVLALVLTLAMGSLLLMLLGKEPVRGLMVFFWEPIRSPYALGELMVKATPLLLIATGLTVAYRANVWNIGAEGQYVLGAIAATWVALQVTPDQGPWVVIPIVMAGLLGGMAWAAITAIPCAT